MFAYRMENLRESAYAKPAMSSKTKPKPSASSGEIVALDVHRPMNVSKRHTAAMERSTVSTSLTR